MNYLTLIISVINMCLLLNIENNKGYKEVVKRALYKANKRQAMIVDREDPLDINLGEDDL